MSYDPEEEMNYRRKQSGTVLVEQSRMEGLKARIRELESQLAAATHPVQENTNA